MTILCVIISGVKFLSLSCHNEQTACKMNNNPLKIDLIYMFTSFSASALNDALKSYMKPKLSTSLYYFLSLWHHLWTI